jgi:hypothetical protein
MAPADELAEIRAEIARLKLREARLVEEVAENAVKPLVRAGWPIVRQASSRTALAY